RQLKGEDRTIFASFSEGGRCRAFLHAARQGGFDAIPLVHDTPHFGKAVGEITDLLRQFQADLLLCHGYKANLLGRPAARRAVVPAVAVARGWTAESWRVRLYERLDRFH